ncbi:hypothetical protein ACFL5X_01740 [Candidatus Omnitrophota bacterium]
MNSNLRRVIPDVASHLCIGLIGSGLIYIALGNKLYALAFFLGSIFIDLDHLIDYFMYFGFHFSLKKFFSLEYLRSGKVYMFFHSWELFIIIFAVSIAFDFFPLFFFSLAIAVHLLFDTLHRIRPLFYFLIYRAAKNFDARLLCPECLEDFTHPTP